MNIIKRWVQGMVEASVERAMRESVRREIAAAADKQIDEDLSYCLQKEREWLQETLEKRLLRETDRREAEAISRNQ